MSLKTLSILPIVLIASTAVAQDAEIDVNGDGMYSYPELQAAMPEMTEDEFTVLDTTGDGLLDADEIAVGTDAGLLPAMDG